MSKKGVIIAVAAAVAVMLGGCAPREPMPQSHAAYQTGPSTKLGTTHYKYKHRTY